MPRSATDSPSRTAVVWSLPVRMWAALAPDCTDQERTRAARFVFAEDRRAYLAAHGLVRRALEEYFPGHGLRTVQFSAGRYGKPYLPVGRPDVRFSLSHCSTRVCCVICPNFECGIDVEPLGRAWSPSLERAALTARERRLLSGQPGGRRSASFLRIWTAKEAVLKALGTGLSYPLEAVEIDIAGDGARIVSIGGEVARGWALRQWRLADSHVETVAVRTDGCPVSVRRASPPRACPDQFTPALLS